MANTTTTTRAAGMTSHQAYARSVPRSLTSPSQMTLFEYVGESALTVFGAATRVRYRFEKTGARIAVDARDGASLDGVPSLRRVMASKSDKDRPLHVENKNHDNPNKRQ